MTQVNGMNVEELREFRAAVEQGASKADRTPVVVARWLGGSRSEVTSLADGASTYIGGKRDKSRDFGCFAEPTHPRRPGGSL